jgi:hypothetical protein
VSRPAGPHGKLDDLAAKQGTIFARGQLGHGDIDQCQMIICQFYFDRVLPIQPMSRPTGQNRCGLANGGHLAAAVADLDQRAVPSST